MQRSQRASGPVPPVLLILIGLSIVFHSGGIWVGLGALLLAKKFQWERSAPSEQGSWRPARAAARSPGAGRGPALLRERPLAASRAPSSGTPRRPGRGSSRPPRRCARAAPGRTPGRPQRRARARRRCRGRAGEDAGRASAATPSGWQSSPNPGRAAADSSTRSPANTTSASGTRTTRSPGRVPAARGGSAPPAGRRGRSPSRRRTSRSAGTISVSGDLLGARVVGSAAYSALIRSPALIVRAACDASWACDRRSAPYASRNTALPKVWSKCSWVLTTPITAPAPRRRTSSTTSRAARLEEWVSTTSRPRSNRRPRRR